MDRWFLARLATGPDARSTMSGRTARLALRTYLMAEAAPRYSFFFPAVVRQILRKNRGNPPDLRKNRGLGRVRGEEILGRRRRPTRCLRGAAGALRGKLGRRRRPGTLKNVMLSPVAG